MNEVMIFHMFDWTAESHLEERRTIYSEVRSEGYEALVGRACGHTLFTKEYV